MSRWALIINETVHEITAIDPANRFASDMLWVKCAAPVKVGHLYANGSFTAPGLDLEKLKAARIEDLRSACEVAIVGGFSSAALGDDHIYPSDVKAQLNLMGSVTESLLPDLALDWQTPFWVCDETHVWSYKMHSPFQIQQAGRDGKAHVISCQSTLGMLTAAVQDAETKTEVDSIVWPFKKAG